MREKELNLYDLYRMAKEGKILNILADDPIQDQKKAKKNIESFASQNQFLMSLGIYRLVR